MRRRDLLLTSLLIPEIVGTAFSSHWLRSPGPTWAQERVRRVGALSPTHAAIDTIRRVTLPELARLGFRRRPQHNLPWRLC